MWEFSRAFLLQGMNFNGMIKACERNFSEITIEQYSMILSCRERTEYERVCDYNG